VIKLPNRRVSGDEQLVGVVANFPASAHDHYPASVFPLEGF